MESVRTPAFIVHLEKLRKNCQRIIQKAKDANISLRPHIKTHKTIEGAMYQLYGEKNDRGDGKIVVSTLNEAQVRYPPRWLKIEFYADSKKFSDIIYAVPIVASKMDLASSLQNQIKLSILVDSNQAIDQLEDFCIKNPSKVQRWNVLLKVPLYSRLMH